MELGLRPLHFVLAEEALTTGPILSVKGIAFSTYRSGLSWAGMVCRPNRWFVEEMLTRFIRNVIL